MSKDTRQYLVLVALILLAAAAGVVSVFTGGRMLAWIVIAISDSYLLLVLLLAAIHSDDETFLDKRPWITYFFPLKTTGRLVATLVFAAGVCGFAGLYVGTDVFRPGETTLNALYISFFIMGFTDYSPNPAYGQLVVMAQPASGILLLVALFPLLISPISTFKSP